MLVTAIKTEKVTPRSTTLIALLDRTLKKVPGQSVLVITSKIVALCEGRFLTHDTTIKDAAVIAEADYYLPKEHSRYGIPLTIFDNAFIARAGIDASNTDGYYSLLPKDSYATAKKIRAYLVQRFQIQQVGVVIVDSHSTPLRRGTLGVAIGWSGFQGLKNYEAEPDIFGHYFTTHQNQVDALATAASLCMGEGNEQTPLCLISDIPFITFAVTSPTKQELAIFKPALKVDLFAPLLNFRALKKGRK
ncbi:MAG: coenzyme F420-0:L-glutamate ligase [Candidatus Moranbacteria bacterium]|jgi:F420-0:gamma-glutamyl ligase|nr:coenzyme F420-0:L-glutamate ligase [Candidatus Moranbacteria bacterium]